MMRLSAIVSVVFSLALLPFTVHADSLRKSEDDCSVTKRVTVSYGKEYTFWVDGLSPKTAVSDLTVESIYTYEKVPGDTDGTSVSVSGSSQVQPAQWNEEETVLTACVDVFVAPKTNLKTGFFKEYVIELTSDGTKFVSVTDVTEE